MEKLLIGECLADGDLFTDTNGNLFTYWKPRWWEPWRWVWWLLWHRRHEGHVIVDITPGNEGIVRCLANQENIDDVEALLEYAYSNKETDLSEERTEKLLKRIMEAHEP